MSHSLSVARRSLTAIYLELILEPNAVIDKRGVGVGKDNIDAGLLKERPRILGRPASITSRSSSVSVLAPAIRIRSLRQRFVRRTRPQAFGLFQPAVVDEDMPNSRFALEHGVCVLVEM